MLSSSIALLLLASSKIFRRWWNCKTLLVASKIGMTSATPAGIHEIPTREHESCRQHASLHRGQHSTIIAMTDHICNLFLEDFAGVSTAPSALLDEDWNCRKCGRIAADHAHRQQQRSDDSWYRVAGAISRPGNHAGAHYNLFSFASSDGL